MADAAEQPADDAGEETTDTTITDRTVDPADQVNDNDYDFLLPSASLRYNLNDRDRLIVSAARTVRRPNFDSLSPALLEEEALSPAVCAASWMSLASTWSGCPARGTSRAMKTSGLTAGCSSSGRRARGLSADEPGGAETGPAIRRSA